MLTLNSLNSKTELVYKSSIPSILPSKRIFWGACWSNLDFTEF